MQKSGEKQPRDPGTPNRNPGLKRKNSKFDLQENEETTLYRVSDPSSFLANNHFLLSLNSNMTNRKKAPRLFGS